MPFTPGPWTSTHYGRIEKGIELIADVNGVQPTKAANARLIGCAPELLQALEGLVRAIGEPMNKADFSIKLSAARSLIKKARGEE